MAMTERDLSQQTRFRSILFPEEHEFPVQETSEAPAFFHDLNLDQIVRAITARWQDYNLARTSLHSAR